MRRLVRSLGWVHGILVLAAATAAGQDIVSDSIPGTLVKFELVRIPGGGTAVEGVAQEVGPVLMGRTEATWEMYDAFTLSRSPSPRYAPAGADAVAGPSRPYGNPDYGFGHAGFPVISVTRAAAEAFCAWLSSVTGHRYRLPTDAEWQRAADLAGSEDGWHAGNAEGRTHAVGSLAPTSFGLFDIFGNVAEWVTTGDGSLVVRGGSWRDGKAGIGPSARERQQRSWNQRDPQIPKSSWWLSDGPFVGFRVVREP
ncbi:MAG: formylglycine-generating enzyme family protein [Gemmatimonadales bacterium]